MKFRGALKKKLEIFRLWLNRWVGGSGQAESFFLKKNKCVPNGPKWILGMKKNHFLYDTPLHKNHIHF